MTRRRSPKLQPSSSPPVAARTKYFTASWCPPCRVMHRLLARHPDLAARLEILDVDEHEALADAHDIDCVPTFVRPDGVRRSGPMTAKELRAFLDG